MTLKFILGGKHFRHCNSSHDVMCMHALCGDVNAAGNNIYIKCSIADQEGKNHHRKFNFASRFNLHCNSISQQTREHAHNDILRHEGNNFGDCCIENNCKFKLKLIFEIIPCRVLQQMSTFTHFNWKCRLCLHKQFNLYF